MSVVIFISQSKGHQMCYGANQIAETWNKNDMQIGKKMDDFRVSEITS